MKTYAFMIALWFTCLIASNMALISAGGLEKWFPKSDLPPLTQEEGLVVQQLSSALGKGALLKAHETSIGYTSGHAKAVLTWAAGKHGVVVDNQCNYDISYSLKAEKSGLWYYGSEIKSRQTKTVPFAMGHSPYDGDIRMFILARPKEK